ncbi:hypothetical protein [Saccharibacillus deserti]|uniref:hypothetical protein n=1 Tax=Saccharibacillus deserti TaxID=1634444 RepID=UPI00155814A5|nr:hypothetical protein [Saccharibacillus deserti]
MTTHRNSERDRRLAEEAWTKMENQLRLEPVNPVWAAWGEREKGSENGQQTQTALRTGEEPLRLGNSVSGGTNLPEQEALSDRASNAAVPVSALDRKRRKRIVRFAAAAAAAAVIVTAVTPAGNQAMASILNKFTMQDVVLVQESDMENMVQMVYGTGENRESVNKYGSFVSTALENGFDPDASAEEIRAGLGYAPITAVQGRTGSLNASLGSKTVMKLHVAEVNETLKRLGAEHLFPQEADGKAITLTYPSSVMYNFGTAEGWAQLTQSEMPTVEFDPSFPVEETMDAVINFPYLPEELRDSLQQAAVSDGRLPLPMYADGQAQSLEFSGVKVTYAHSEAGRSRTAFWVKNGQLFEFDAHDSFPGGEAGFLDFVKGLAAQW